LPHRHGFDHERRRGLMEAPNRRRCCGDLARLASSKGYRCYERMRLLLWSRPSRRTGGIGLSVFLSCICIGIKTPLHLPMYISKDLGKSAKLLGVIEKCWKVLVDFIQER
jgi:hypothetical protein